MMIKKINENKIQSKTMYKQYNYKLLCKIVNTNFNKLKLKN